MNANAKAIERESAPQERRLTLRDYVMGDAVKMRLRDVASKYLQPDEIARCVLVAASRNPRIAECTQDSILRCMMDAATIGIRPGGTMGRGWLIPRYNGKIRAYELNFDPGWRGLADIARRSKVVKRIEARVVHALDTFRVVEGTDGSIQHIPYDGDDDPGPIRAAYAVAFLEDGQQFEVIWKRDLDRIAGVSTSRDKDGNATGPWKDWPEEMARKSAVRRLCKHLPVDEELEYALEVATRAEMPATEIAQVPEATDAPRAKRLADSIRARQQPAEEPAAEAPAEDASLDVGDDPGGLA